MKENDVIVYRTSNCAYPKRPPFSPSEQYPEYALGDPPASEPNPAYEAVRGAMRLGGLDADRYGTADWNPLGEFIRPGQFVLLKPNMVKESHPRDPEGWVYMLTHGSVIRAVADYVWKALDGQGRLMIADAPQADSSFKAMVRVLSLDAIQSFYREKGLDLELVDLRPEEWTNVENVIVDRQPLPGDPNGSVAFNLSRHSEFADHAGQGKYYGADYETREVNAHHTGGRHEYLLSGSAIKCDVFINLPKLKTHKKAGVTINLKNLVGINADKNWLPHHTEGYPRNGGDQFPEPSVKTGIERAAVRSMRKLICAMPGLGAWTMRRARRIGMPLFGDSTTVIRSGNWHGNDTTWRMCLDLNKALLYGALDGSLRTADLSQRKAYLCFTDGILGGEGNGPMDPDPVESGVLLFGLNPVPVDATGAVLMGFDINKIPIIRQAFHPRGYPLAGHDLGAVSCISNVESWSGTLADLATSTELFEFRPHFGWVGHIERRAAAAAAATGRGA
jgi:uncharacterized protein (DUF362 family)